MNDKLQPAADNYFELDHLDGVLENAAKVCAW